MSAPATIAIVSWNTRELLAACLASLVPDVEAGRADVWVVDNASADGSAAMVRERFGWATLVAGDENLGFGPAVNVVARRTRSPWIAPANADLRFTPGALERLLREGEAHPEAGAVAPRLVLPDGSTQDSVYPFPTLRFTALNAVGAGRAAFRWSPQRAGEVPWAVGAFLLVRRAAWDAVGGFDERQWMYAEDLDLGWRLRRAGWRTRYVPDARVHHDESAAVKQAWGAERFAQWHASTYAWMLHRRGPALTRAVAAVNVAGYGARALVRTGAARRSAHNAVRAHALGLRPRATLERHR